jgi:factor associated with neutral sphingomyelinase activation
MARRFNLFLLEENEFFLEDYICYHHKLENVREKGRLKICSRSLVFEPEELFLPLLKMSFKDMLECPSVHSWMSNRLARISTCQSSLDSREELKTALHRCMHPE